MAKRQVYSFEEKKYSANQIASAVLGVLSVIVLAGLLGISFLMKGMANTWIGAVGFTGIVMAVCGLWYGFAGFKDDSKSYFCSKCGGGGENLRNNSGQVHLQRHNAVRKQKTV